MVVNMNKKELKKLNSHSLINLASSALLEFNKKTRTLSEIDIKKLKKMALILYCIDADINDYYAGFKSGRSINTALN
jgi:hypothetical protein